MGELTTEDGATIFFTVEGTGEPLLLIAGNALDHHGWDGVFADFAARHTVIRYDHRGTGISSAEVPDGATTRDFARDAVAVIAAAGFVRAHVYGHSMGGRIAQWLAADRPDAVGALILGGTTLGDAAGVPRPAAATKALTSGDPAQLRRLFYADDWIAAHPDEADAIFPRAASPEALRGHMVVSSGHDGREAAPRITAPTLVIHGTDDQLALPENARILAAAIPGAELQLIEGGRHAYWAGHPEANAAILAFIAAHRLD